MSSCGSRFPFGEGGGRIARDIGRQGSACRVAKTTKVDILCI